MATRETRVMWVNPFAEDPLRYGFRTTARASVSQILGHTLVDATTPPANLIFGARRPKPRVARRFSAQQHDSSFVDAGSVDAARTAGFTIGRVTPYGNADSNIRTQVHFVTINGIKYAWNLPNRTRTAFATNLEGIGVKPAGTGDNDLVFGANFPTPPLVAVERGSTGRFSRTFADPSRLGNLPAGAELVRAGRFRPQDVPF